MHALNLILHVLLDVCIVTKIMQVKHKNVMNIPAVINATRPPVLGHFDVPLLAAAPVLCTCV